MIERSTKELFPEHDLDRSGLDELRSAIEEGLEMLAIVRELIAEATASRAGDFYIAMFKTAELHIASAVAAWIDGLERLLVAIETATERCMSLEWQTLADPKKTDPERYSAALRLAARWNAIAPGRREAHEERILDGLSELSAARGGISLRKAKQEIVAHALLVAAVEGMTPQDRVTLEVDGSRKKYVHGLDGGQVVPRRDLPIQFFRRWVHTQVGNDVMNELVPGWREYEKGRVDLAVGDHEGDDEAVDERLIDRRTSGLDSSVEPDAADDLLARIVPERDRELARLLFWERLSSREVGARLGIEPATVRKRKSRLRLALKSQRRSRSQLSG